uniref:Uncharacterized protein n=1 Tax=Arundo donax TaxID=35708 RepID=A0A0A8Y0H2_ARUDO
MQWRKMKRGIREQVQDSPR